MLYKTKQGHFWLRENGQQNCIIEGSRIHPPGIFSGWEVTSGIIVSCTIFLV